MSATMLGAVVLWVLGDSLGVPAVTAAMLGLAALLTTGVLTWRDCLDYSQARTHARPHGTRGLLPACTGTRPAGWHARVLGLLFCMRAARKARCRKQAHLLWLGGSALRQACAPYRIDTLLSAPACK